MSAIVYLRKQSPTKALEGVMPHKAWSGTKPDVCSLRIFRCSANAHVPKAKRHKLAKTRKRVALGYITNYCLYDLRWMKVIYSRNVVFDETSMPGVQNEKELPPK